MYLCAYKHLLQCSTKKGNLALRNQLHKTNLLVGIELNALARSPSISGTSSRLVGYLVLGGTDDPWPGLIALGSPSPLLLCIR